MALTPETSAALDEALSAVIEECGDTPGYEGLIDSLQATKTALADVADAPAEHSADADEADAHEEDDAYSFEHAEKKHKAARKKPKADDAEGEGDNPFAKKGE